MLKLGLLLQECWVLCTHSVAGCCYYWGPRLLMLVVVVQGDVVMLQPIGTCQSMKPGEDNSRTQFCPEG